MSVTEKEVRLAAMNLLARREQSYQELVDKLCRRFTYSEDSEAVAEKIVEQIIEQQVQKLTNDGLQSDERFAEMFVRSRIAKSQGPIRIMNELRQRGVSKNVSLDAMENQNADWLELLQQLSIRKFGEGPPENVKERAKRIRFFQYRGFSLDQINSVL